MENNLLNITPDQPIYSFVKKDLVKLIPELNKYMGKYPQLGLIAPDSYFLYYSLIPLLRKENKDKIMGEVLKTYSELMKDNNFFRIRELTKLNDDTSLVHTYYLVKDILEKIKQKEQEKQRQQQNQQGGNGGGQGQSNQQQNNQQSGKGGGSGSNKLSKKELTQAIIQALGNTDEQLSKAQQAHKIIRLAKTLKKGEKKGKGVEVVGGNQAGKEVGKLEFIKSVINLIENVKGVEDIIAYGNQILRAIPRFVKVRKKKAKHGDELIGYGLTKNLTKAIPRELALPDELFLLKLAGSGFLTREKATVMEGAYYVLIDKSGSMSGKKMRFAKSVALAMLKVAREKHREYFLRFFDLIPYDLITNDLIENITYIEASGGTDISKAIKTAISDIRSKGLSDKTNTIIIITDGADNVDEGLSKELRENNITLQAVMIEGENNTLRKLAKESKGNYFKVQPTPQGALRIITEATK